MFGTESQIDASFYRLIHELAGGSKGGPQGGGEEERRVRRRRLFYADHRIAPVYGEQFPDASAFFSVRCHDLTRAGFSFFLPRRPDFTSLVAAFGNAPEVIYVGARVIHCGNVLVHPLGLVEYVDGRPGHVSYQSPTGEGVVPMVLVGCRFTKRLERPPAPGEADTPASLPPSGGKTPPDSVNGS